MDLLDFTGEDLYFDEAANPEITRLLGIAADQYGSQQAEHALLRAYFQDPENLTVLVGLYRYYYYQRRLEDALIVADRSLLVVGRRLGIREDWRLLDEYDLAQAAHTSMTLLRFYLYALKGAAYLQLRLGNASEALERLAVITRLDPADRIGVQPLIDVANAAIANGELQAIAV